MRWMVVNSRPFDANGKNQAVVSHISFYNSAAPAAVPLPTAAWLLLLAGLGGLGGRAEAKCPGQPRLIVLAPATAGRS